MSYPELQEKIDELVGENKRLKGENCILVDLLDSLAFFSAELIEEIESDTASEILKSLVESVQYVLKQLPDDIKY